MLAAAICCISVLSTASLASFGMDVAAMSDTRTFMQRIPSSLGSVHTGVTTGKGVMNSADEVSYSHNGSATKQSNTTATLILTMIVVS
jgi:hypothetical protein